jgi:hypothetical protein
VRVSQLLLAHGLQHLMPLPQPLAAAPARRRARATGADARRAMLADGSLQRWHDFAVLSYDYDGERVSFDPSQRVVRQEGDVTKLSSAHGAEARALALLAERHSEARLRP